MNLSLSVRKCNSLWLGLALAGAVTAAQANLITNGDFEDSSKWDAWTFDATAAGGSAGAASYNFGIRDASGFGHGGPAQGNYVGGLEWSPGTVSLTQNVAGLIAGTLYTLSFELNLRDPAGQEKDTFWVEIDGTTVFLGGDPSTYASGYVPLSLTFTAAGASAEIKFLGQVSSDVSYNLDNVTLEQAVPEPATLGLVGLALAGIGYGRRRSRFARIASAA